MSAGTLAEALIVAAGRGITQQMSDVVEQSRMEIVPVTAATARRIGAIYIRFGKGFHPAGLNYGDCFAYELAMQRDCPLLFVGEDFARTDVKRATGFLTGGRSSPALRGLLLRDLFLGGFPSRALLGALLFCRFSGRRRGGPHIVHEIGVGAAGPFRARFRGSLLAGTEFLRSFSGLLARIGPGPGFCRARHAATMRAGRSGSGAYCPRFARVAKRTASSAARNRAVALFTHSRFS